MTIILIASHGLAIAAGAYGWYRWGSSLKADADILRSTIHKL